MLFLALYLIIQLLGKIFPIFNIAFLPIKIFPYFSIITCLANLKCVVSGIIPDNTIIRQKDNLIIEEMREN